MSRTTVCPKCGGNIVEPSFEGDGAYPVEPMCKCNQGCRDWLPARAAELDFEEIESESEESK